MTKPFVIGITGNIACGKSSVMRLLGALGAETIDADIVYHELITPESQLWKALRDRFGEEIIAPDRRVDRKALAAIVFSDPAALAALDGLTHPAVIGEVARRIGQATAQVVTVDAVKLVESGMDQLCDEVWVVTCTPEQQVRRLMARNGLDRSDAEQRVAAQPPVDAKLARGYRRIDNSRTPAETEAQVLSAWRSLPILPNSE